MCLCGFPPCIRPRGAESTVPEPPSAIFRRPAVSQSVSQSRTIGTANGLSPRRRPFPVPPWASGGLRCRLPRRSCLPTSLPPTPFRSIPFHSSIECFLIRRFCSTPREKSVSQSDQISVCAWVRGVSEFASSRHQSISFNHRDRKKSATLVIICASVADLGR